MEEKWKNKVWDNLMAEGFKRLVPGNGSRKCKETSRHSSASATVSARHFPVARLSSRILLTAGATSPTTSKSSPVSDKVQRRFMRVHPIPA